MKENIEALNTILCIPISKDRQAGEGFHYDVHMMDVHILLKKYYF